MLRLLLAIHSHMSPRRRLQLIGVMALMLAGTAAEVFTLGAIFPFLGLLVNPGMADQHPILAFALDTVAPWVGGTRLAAASLWFILFAVLSAALRLTLNWASLRFVFSVGADFGESIYSRVLQQPYSYHIERNSSVTLAAVDKAGTMVMGLMAPLMQAAIAIVMVSAILMTMIWINPSIALGAGLVFGGLYTAINTLANQQLRANGLLITNNITKKIKAMQEGLGAIRDVIIDGNHATYTKHFAHADRAQRLAQAQNLVIAGSPKYVVESMGMILFVGLALWLTSTPGGITQAVPTLGALALGVQRLLPYMQNIYNGVATAKGTVAIAEEILSLLSLPINAPHLAENSTVSTKNSPDRNCIIELKDISFSYQRTGTAVLNGINLTISRGSKIGLIGATGSGKSTLMDIIMGLLPPTSGQLIIHGYPAEGHRLQSWQRRIAHVPQSIFLTDNDIAENIALGVSREQIDFPKLKRVIELAQLSEMIMQLPDGMQTRVGERGVQLSGGQRQRIGLARALYKNADVLVLDEATSALDSATEAKVMESIYQLNPKMVILMIAHRTSTLKNCDLIYKVTTNELIPIEGYFE